ncbi:MAG: hypothetical protein HZB46_06410 [Solirubrobacterales bacterium]|nr:hypothetical protein [Solirubrobacterales bacterium]
MRVRLLVLAATLAAALAAPAASHALVLGIGDQKPDMFSDPRFHGLGVRHARLAVSWDALNSDWERAELDQWLNAARASGVTPLVGFWHARGDRRRVLPTPERLKWEFRQFRARYPWVTTFATWNEANHCGEPTCHRPQLVAAYYRALRKECPTCTILAAEVLDMPNMRSWLRAFTRHLGYRPRLWGLHNYIDANRFRTAGTRTMLRTVPGHVWLTETGGIVERRNKRKVGFEESPAHAAKATRWVFDRLVPLSRRITRVYLYHWNALPPPENWDSALVDYRGRARPALRVVRRVMAAAAARREARVRRAARARTAHRPPA